MEKYIRSTNLHGSTDVEYKGGDEKTPLATSKVANRVPKEGTEETASLVERDDVLLRVAELRSTHLLEAEFIDETREGQSRSNESAASLY